MTMQMYIVRYQLRYKIYKTSNHNINSSSLHPEAQQGIPLLVGSFATCHSDSGTTRLCKILADLEMIPQWFSLTVYRCHHLTRVVSDVIFCWSEPISVKLLSHRQSCCSSCHSSCCLSYCSKLCRIVFKLCRIIFKNNIYLLLKKYYLFRSHACFFLGRHNATP